MAFTTLASGLRFSTSDIRILKTDIQGLISNLQINGSVLSWDQSDGQGNTTQQSLTLPSGGGIVGEYVKELRAIENGITVIRGDDSSYNVMVDESDLLKDLAAVATAGIYEINVDQHGLATLVRAASDSGGVTTQEVTSLIGNNVATWAIASNTDLIPADKLPSSMAGGGTDTNDLPSTSEVNFLRGNKNVPAGRNDFTLTAGVDGSGNAGYNNNANSGFGSISVDLPELSQLFFASPSNTYNSRYLLLYAGSKTPVNLIVGSQTLPLTSISSDTYITATGQSAWTNGQVIENVNVEFSDGSFLSQTSEATNTESKISLEDLKTSLNIPDAPTPFDDTQLKNKVAGLEEKTAPIRQDADQYNSTNDDVQSGLFDEGTTDANIISGSFASTIPADASARDNKILAVSYPVNLNIEDYALEEIDSSSNVVNRFLGNQFRNIVRAGSTTGMGNVWRITRFTGRNSSSGLPTEVTDGGLFRGVMYANNTFSDSLYLLFLPEDEPSGTFYARISGRDSVIGFSRGLRNANITFNGVTYVMRWTNLASNFNLTAPFDLTLYSNSAGTTPLNGQGSSIFPLVANKEIRAYSQSGTDKALIDVGANNSFRLRKIEHEFTWLGSVEQESTLPQSEQTKLNNSLRDLDLGTDGILKVFDNNSTTNLQSDIDEEFNLPTILSRYFVTKDQAAGLGRLSEADISYVKAIQPKVLLQHSETSQVQEDSVFGSNYFDYRSSSENYLPENIAYDDSTEEISGLDTTRRKLVAVKKGSSFGNHLGIKNGSGLDVGIVRTDSNNVLQVNSTGLRASSWVNVTTGLSTDALTINSGDTLLIEVVPDNANSNNILIEIDILRADGTVIELSANSIPHNSFDWDTLILRDFTEIRGCDLAHYVGHDARRELLENHAEDKWVFGKAALTTHTSDDVEISGDLNITGDLKIKGESVDPSSGGGGTDLTGSGYLHLGVANIEGGDTGLVAGTTGHAEADGDRMERPLRFAVANTNVTPTGGSYDSDTGNIILPEGHWLVCASVVVANNGTNKTDQNSRVRVILGIKYGDNIRHEQSDYSRWPNGATSRYSSAVDSDFSECKVSVAGGVISDGSTALTINLVTALQGQNVGSTDEACNILSAHVHAYKQIV